MTTDRLEEMAREIRLVQGIATGPARDRTYARWAAGLEAQARREGAGAAEQENERLRAEQAILRSELGREYDAALCRANVSGRAALAQPEAAPVDTTDYRALYEEIVVRCRKTAGRCFCGVHITRVAQAEAAPKEESRG